MDQKFKRPLAALLTLIALFAFTACPAVAVKVPPAVPPDQVILYKTQYASTQASAIIKTAAQTVQDLEGSGTITKAEAQNARNWIRRINADNLDFTNRLNSYTNFSTSHPADLAKLSKDISGFVTNLQSNGSIKFASASATASFLAITDAASAILQQILSQIGPVPQTNEEDQNDAK